MSIVICKVVRCCLSTCAMLSGENGCEAESSNKLPCTQKGGKKRIGLTLPQRSMSVHIGISRGEDLRTGVSNDCRPPTGVTALLSKSIGLSEAACLISSTDKVP
jgi:hypothetical protein